MKAYSIAFEKDTEKPYTDQQIERIQAILESFPRKRHYTPPLKFENPLEEVKDAAEWFLAFRKRNYPGRYSERRKTLERFSNWCLKAIKNRKFLEQIESFLAEDPSAFASAGISLFELENLYERWFLVRQHEENPKETERKLTDFLLLAKDELRKMPPDRGGPDVDVGQREFILRIIHTTAKFTGKPKGTGLAFREIPNKGYSPEGDRVCPSNEEPTTWEKCRWHQEQGHFYGCPTCRYRDDPKQSSEESEREYYKESEREYYGPLLDLINACLEPLDPEWKKKSNTACGGKIQTCLKYVNPRLKISS